MKKLEFSIISAIRESSEFKARAEKNVIKMSPQMRTPKTQKLSNRSRISSLWITSASMRARRVIYTTIFRQQRED